MNIRIDAIHFEADKKLKELILEKSHKLEKYFDRIQSIDVKLKLDGSHQVKDKIVELIVHVPGDRLVASRSSKTFESACDSAVKAMKIQIKDYKQKLLAR